MPDKVNVPDIWAEVGPEAMSDTPWVPAGEYEVIRELDEEHYLIRLDEKTITAVKKSLTS